MGASLVDVESLGQWPLSRGVDNVVGRAEENRVRLPIGSVGRRHARLRDDDSGWYAEDLGSTGGTWWSGGGGRWERIVGRTLMRSGDLLRVGAVTLRFVDDGLAADGEQPADAIVAQLRNRLAASDDPYSVQCLVACLDRRGGDPRPVLEALREAIRSPTPETRLVAAFGLGQLGRSSRSGPGPLDELLALTVDRVAAVRREAVAQLGTVLSAPLEALVEALEDPDEDVFRAALSAVSRRGGVAGQALAQLVRRAPEHRRVDLKKLSVEVRSAPGDEDPEPEPGPALASSDAVAADDRPPPRQLAPPDAAPAPAPAPAAVDPEARACPVCSRVAGDDEAYCLRCRSPLPGALQTSAVRLESPGAAAGWAIHDTLGARIAVLLILLTLGALVGLLTTP